MARDGWQSQRGKEVITGLGGHSAAEEETAATRKTTTATPWHRAISLGRLRLDRRCESRVHNGEVMYCFPPYVRPAYIRSAAGCASTLLKSERGEHGVGWGNSGRLAREQCRRVGLINACSGGGAGRTDGCENAEGCVWESWGDGDEDRLLGKCLKRAAA